MIIQNKRGEQKSIRPQDWEKMEQLGFAAGWSILSNDLTTIRKAVPKELIDFNLIKNRTKNGTKGKPAISGDKTVQSD